MEEKSIAIYLCITEMESGKPQVKAVYDNELEAEAWVAGAEAAYGSGYYMAVNSNEGAIDINEWLKEAKG